MKNPELEKIINNAPLYSSVFEKTSLDKLSEFINREYTIDSFCTTCDESATFQHFHPMDYGGKKIHRVFEGISKNDTYSFPNLSEISTLKELENYEFEITISCTRCKTNKILSHYLIIQEEAIKIGQFPSISTLQNLENKKYKKYLGQNYSEYSKGVGLVSHGIGIGSFVYLRRVIERLIESAKIDAIKNGTQIDAKFDSSRFTEKIEYLKDYLPTFLNQNKRIYGIISKGIHELNEKECLKYHPIIKMSIELILDQQISKDELAKKEAETAKLLNLINIQ